MGSGAATREEHALAKRALRGVLRPTRLVFLVAVLLAIAAYLGIDDHPPPPPEYTIHLQRPVPVAERRFDARVEYLGLHGDILLVGLPDSAVALRASDMSPLWSRPLSAEWSMPPLFDRGLFYVAGGESPAGPHWVLEMDASTGEILLRRSRSQLSAPPHRAGGMLVLGRASGELMATRSPKSVEWTTSLGGWKATELVQAGPITFVLASSRRGRGRSSSEPSGHCALGILTSTGWMLWKTGLVAERAGHPLVCGNTALVSVDDSTVGIDVRTGSIRWSRPVPATDLLAEHWGVVMAAGAGQVHLLEPARGVSLKLGNLRVPHRDMLTPAGDALYCRREGRLVCLSLPSLDPLWAISLGDRGETVLDENRLYCSAGKMVYLFAPSGLFDSRVTSRIPE